MQSAEYRNNVILNLLIFEVFIGKLKDDDGFSYWSVEIFNVNWPLFAVIILLLNLCSYALGVFLGGYNYRVEYDKLVDKYNRYVELCQRESVAWKSEDDVPCKPGYKAEFVHVYSRENYHRLMQYGEQLTYSIQTNFVKITSDN